MPFVIPPGRCCAALLQARERDKEKYLNHDVVAIAADEKSASRNSESFLDGPTALIGRGKGVTHNLRVKVRKESSQNWHVVRAEGQPCLVKHTGDDNPDVRILDARRIQHYLRRPRQTPLQDTTQNQCHTRLFLMTTTVSFSTPA